MRWQLDVRSTAAGVGLALMCLAAWPGSASRAQPEPPIPQPPPRRASDTAAPGPTASGALPPDIRDKALAAPLTQPVSIPNEVMVYFTPGLSPAAADASIATKLGRYARFYEEDKGRRVLEAGMAVVRRRTSTPAAMAHVGMATALADATAGAAAMAAHEFQAVLDSTPVDPSQFLEELQSSGSGGRNVVVKTPPSPRGLPTPKPPQVAAASGGAPTVGIDSAGMPVGGVGPPDWVSDATGLRNGTLWGLRTIRAPYAWKGREPRKNPVLVAVLDTGINLNHPNLPKNIDGPYRINIRPNEPPDQVDDKNGHGTHIAGIIGAVGRLPGGAGDPRSVVGVNWDIQMAATRFLDDAGLAPYDYAVRAAATTCTRLAGDKKTRLVVNMSWAVGGLTQGELDRLENVIRSYKDNVLFVAAAGNVDVAKGETANDNDQTPIYPASLTRKYDNVISVLAIDRCDRLPSYSNYGEESVDIGAPGGLGQPSSPGGPEENIYRTWILDPDGRGNYATAAGTSMATAYVSAAAAFLWAEHADWAPGKIKDALTQNARKVPALAGKCSSGGVLNLGFMATGVAFELLPEATCAPATAPRSPLPELDLGYVQPWAFVPPASASPYVSDLYRPGWPPTVYQTFAVGMPAPGCGIDPAGMPLLPAGTIVAFPADPGIVGELTPALSRGRSGPEP